MLAALIGSLFDNLDSWSARPWFLLVIFAVALFDSVVPVVPSETTVIIGGVAAGLADPQQNLFAVIAAAALGAWCGDNLAYQLGTSAKRLLLATLFRGEKGAKRLDWAANMLETRGGMLLVTARFIPGGRTAITVSSGLTQQPRKRFAFFVAIAAAIWATYAALLGYIGGKTFAGNHTKAFLMAFGCAIAVTVVIEAVRHIRGRRSVQTKANQIA